MKRVGAAVLLPFLLLALEKVNLIKNSSFERDDETWHAWTESDAWPSVSISNKHDSCYIYSGRYSGSGDTRPNPGEIEWNYLESAYLVQAIPELKTLEDVDSLMLTYAVFPLNGVLTMSCASEIFLHFNREGHNWLWIGYGIKTPDWDLVNTSFLKHLGQVDFPDDTLWHEFTRNIGEDIRQNQDPVLSPTEQVDSLVIRVIGVYRNPWRGQKVFFDDVRLMGYADFDVGVKEITSAEVASPDVPYTPEARIKNFGREDADDFSIILTIEDSTGIMRIDTVPYTLPADTEDTLAFDSVTFPVPGAYNLHIRTEMVPDECDEDDEKSLQIAVTGIEEPVTHQPDKVDLDVRLVRAGFRISHSISAGQTGTITLYNSAGQRMESKTVQGAGETVMGEGLSNGVYFVMLDSPDYSLSHKVVVVQ
ncbi:T9SS type A sorting domain-containing protein [candidate division WOR-3 bacterium]|nr:T9SS type A sorting domain-containing protein [candidate division WOR-3 bacterium]